MWRHVHKERRVHTGAARSRRANRAALRLDPAYDSRSVSDDNPGVLRNGIRIQEYEIVRVLGQGGFGITYLAFDLNLNGPVALKEYFPDGYARRLPDGSVGPASSDSQGVFAWGLKTFLAEAQAIHRFRHPNVVRAHRYFEARGGAFIAMEYVEGDSLEKILRDRPRLTAAEWRPLLEKLLDGLEHVHDHDYLHRDLKPGNIIVRDTNGAPVLIDFGSARFATGEKAHTQVFTAEYAPLEQHGKGRQAPAADLYALAAVSYRVLLGERPPAAPDRVIGDSIARLEQRVEDSEREWLAALDQCLAIQPKDRPQSVAELRRAIRKRPHTADNPEAHALRADLQRTRNRTGPPKDVEPVQLSEPSDGFGRTTRTDDNYKDPQTLTNVTKGFLYAGIAMSCAALVSNLLEYQLLDAVRAGFNPGEAALEGNDTRQAWAAALGLAVHLPTVPLVLMWIHRANYNVRQLGARGLRFSPAGSIGWYFVPLLWFWRPYQAMQEIWKASMNPRDWPAVPVPRILPLWWAFWLVSNFLNSLHGNLWSRLGESPGIGDLIGLNTLAQVVVLWDVALSLLLLAIMKGIQQKQAEYRRVSLRAPQSPTMSPVAILLAVSRN